MGKNDQVVRVADTFYHGMAPTGEDPSYYYREEGVFMPVPLAPWVPIQIMANPFLVPPSMVFDLTLVEFFISVLVGAQWVDLPDDYVRWAMYFELLRDGASPWGVSAFQVGTNTVQPGVDLLNRNLLTLFGVEKNHLVISGGSQITAQYTPYNVVIPFPGPGQAVAGIRYAGRLITKETWKRVAI